MEKARACLALEEAAIRATAESLDERFVAVIAAVRRTMLAGRKLIFTGVGKNVAICHKLAGTFNSTGVPATVLDPNQALHGDLGLCRDGDLVFLLSNSGQTEEVLRLVPLLKRLGGATVAVTNKPESDLGRACDLLLVYRAEMEACPLNLAPTASTTAALALGDALAMVYLDLRGFSKDDFARYHPAGTLGRSLLLRVDEIMRTGDRFACLPETANVREVILAMTQARTGTTALFDPADGRLAGVFTDGDFRRQFLQDPSCLERPVAAVMGRNPKSVPAGALAVEALRRFEELAVDDLIAVDADGRPIGLIDGQDLPKVRLV